VPTILRTRLPSTGEALRVFLAGVFLIHVWAIVVVLHAAPAWMLQLDAWDLVGALSYPLVVALVESIVIFGLVSGLAVAVPRSWLRRNFIAATTGIVYFAAVWAAVGHFNDQTLRSMNIRQLAPWAVIFVASQVAVVWAIHRSQRLRSLIERGSLIGCPCQRRCMSCWTSSPSPLFSRAIFEVKWCDDTTQPSERSQTARFAAVCRCLVRDRPSPGKRHITSTAAQFPDCRIRRFVSLHIFRCTVIRGRPCRI
jgi:hypothetical protein